MHFFGKFFTRWSRGFSSLVLIVVVGAVAAAGAGAVGYYYYAKIRPEKVIRRAFTNFSAAKTFEYEGSITAALHVPTTSLLPAPGLGELPKKDSSSLDGVNKSRFALVFRSTADITDPAKQRGAFAATLTMDDLPGLTAKQEIGFETRIIEDVLYVKVAQLPDLGFFDAGVITRQWIKFDIAGLLAKVGVENPDEILNEVKDSRRPTPTEAAELKALMVRSNLVTITSVASDKADGIALYRYEYVVNKDQLKPFLVEAAKIMRLDQELGKELNELDQALAKVEAPTGQVWVRKKEMTPYKVTTHLEPSKTLPPEEQGGAIDATILFKSFNQPVEVETPAEFKTLDELLGELLGGFGLGSGLPGTDDYDKDGLTDADEVEYQTNPWNPDTDGDTFRDGDEVKGGFNPIGLGKLPTVPKIKGKK